MSPTIDIRLVRKAAVACGAAALVLATSACGGDGGDTPDATGQADAQGSGPQTRSQGGPDGQLPGANGRVAAVDGSTAQVQGMDGQVAVTWSASTTFTKDVGAALADVRVGDCVLVGPAEEPTADTTGPVAEVTAASVRIMVKSGDSCGPGVRGPGGSADGPRFEGAPPADAPEGGPRPQVRTFGGAAGEVTAVSATGFTVSSVTPGSDEEVAVTVTVGGDTTYTTTATGAASDVQVGVCVMANGDPDDTGAVTAKTIAVSQPQGGQCGGVMRFEAGDGVTSGNQGA